MPVISRIWARSALISAGLQPQQETGTRATGQRNWPTHPAVPPGTDDQNSTPARELEPPQPLLRSLDGGQHPCAKIGANLLAPILGQDHPAWLTARLADLDAGDIPALTAAARDLPNTKAGEVDKALGYFETNAQRMRYARLRELGMFVRSGAVEAGCKAIIGQRLKLPGMRWSERGADAIAALRCHDASGQWAEIWTETHNRTTVA